jgi:hypothetical protein
MPARTVVLTAVVASCVSSLVTLAVALLVLAPSIRAAPDAQNSTGSIVRAERFELVDSSGQLQAVLGTLEEVVGLTILGPTGEAQVRAAVSGDGLPIVAVRNPTGSTGIGLAVRADDTALLNVVSASTGRVAVGAGLGTAGITIHDPADRGRAAIVLRPDGSPGIVLLNEAGQPVWQVPQ